MADLGRSRGYLLYFPAPSLMRPINTGAKPKGTNARKNTPRKINAVSPTVAQSDEAATLYSLLNAIVQTAKTIPNATPTAAGPINVSRSLCKNFIMNLLQSQRRAGFRRFNFNSKKMLSPTRRCRPKAAILIILDPTFSGNDRHPDPDLCVREQLEVEV